MDPMKIGSSQNYSIWGSLLVNQNQIQQIKLIFQTLFKKRLPQMMIEDQEDTQKKNKTEEEVKHDPIFEFKLELTQNLTKANFLFVSLYGAASIYIEACLKPTSKIGHLNFQKAKQLALANIYFENDSIFVVFKDKFPPMHEVYLADLLAEKFVFERAIIIDTRSVALVEDKHLELRVNYEVTQHLKSSSWKDKTLGRLLKDHVLGAPAELLIHAEIHGKQLVYYVGILGEYEFNGQTLDVFKPLEHYDLKMISDPSAALRAYNRKHFSNRLFL